MSVILRKGTEDGRTIKLAGASKEALQKLPEFEFKK
jgi:hypothetical protein